MLQTNKEILEEQIQCVKDKILALNDNLQTLEAMELIEDTVLDDDYDLELQEYEELIKKVYAKTRSKLGMLEPYINDESINEIMVNGKDHFSLRIAMESALSLTALTPQRSWKKLSEILLPAYIGKSMK